MLRKYWGKNMLKKHLNEMFGIRVHNNKTERIFASNFSKTTDLWLKPALKMLMTNPNLATVSQTSVHSFLLVGSVFG